MSVATPSNVKRARSAYVALAYFADTDSGEAWNGYRGFPRVRLIQQNIADLLANLMHYCDQNGFDFEDRLRVARDHFKFEMAE